VQGNNGRSPQRNQVVLVNATQKTKGKIVMSRGIGIAQHDVLLTVAAFEHVFQMGATWQAIHAFVPEDAPRPNVANTYRQLRALERRGLVTMTNDADYRERCRCGHDAEAHPTEVWFDVPIQLRCTARKGTRHWCRCRRYHPSKRPRAHWVVCLTASGQALCSGEELTPIITEIDAWRQRIHENFPGASPRSWLK
jgi:hypothetical protein